VRLTRVSTLLLAGLVALDLVVATVAVGVQQADPLRAAAAELRHAKVAVIVGPVGSLTDSYRALADDAVHAARRLTDDVVMVYSPDATWPAVRRALQGAAIVVYLGHGNGWPSPYSDTLVRRSQDGLGLNPVAGADDEAHQYFGEAAIADSVRLAPGAVVLLHHLCYASGAGEPGQSEPSLAVAEQRVDNFGAGWLAAGASAVIAEGHLGPAYYVTALLAGGSSPEAAWRGSPNFRGNVQASASVRTPGAEVFLDPDTVDSGYFRSLVTLPGAGSPADGGGFASTGDAGLFGAAGSLVAPGAQPPQADLRGSAVAGSVDSLLLLFDSRTVPLLPDRLTVGTRWSKIAENGAAPTQPATQGAAAAPTEQAPVGAADPPAAAGDAPAASAPDATAASDAAPAASTLVAAAAAPTEQAPVSAADPPAAPTPDAAPPDATVAPADGAAAPPVAAAAPDAAPVGAAVVPDLPPVDLVVPEARASVIVTAPASGSGARRIAKVSLPGTPGVYRLVTTLHDADGVAFDAATQALVPALIVHVTDQTWASYGVPDQVGASAGQPVSISIRVANTGSQDWAPRPLGDLVDPEPPQSDPQARLVGHWVHLEDAALDSLPADVLAGSPPIASVMLIASLVPGESEVVDLAVQAPDRPGRYLLVVDLVTSAGSSLAAAGVPPALIRVEVAAPADPVQTPNPAQTSAPVRP